MTVLSLNDIIPRWYDGAGAIRLTDCRLPFVIGILQLVPRLRTHFKVGRAMFLDTLPSDIPLDSEAGILGQA
ncbi:hypothetical protein EAS61_33515 [Bradyrhizobium zhanjiangense]|uniref:Uncharacterized protein n=1 Tax=Bradyrhizobium zhanjiangense TaxID=1325107 RepID=A0A4Q0QB41_9BRAD|nr:hypothetical protein EAS61_33515 [Bradyrhizobium zhanjiangense]